MALHPRIPVYNYTQDYSVSNLTPGTPFLITSPSLNLKRLDITDTSGQAINFLVGTNHLTAFTIPQGGGKFDIQLHPGMSLYLNALTPTFGQAVVNQGFLVITGYY